MPLSPHLLLGLLMGAGASMIWGGHGVVARMALTGQGITVLDMMVCRYVPALLILAPLAWRQRGVLARLGPWRLLALTACGGAFNLWLFATALHWAPASHAGTIAPMTGPVTGALAAWILLGERPTWGRLVALAVMLGGVATIAAADLGQVAGAWKGDLLLFAAGGTWGVFSVLLRLWQVPALAGAAAVTLTSVPFVLPPFLVFRAAEFFALDWRLVLWMVGAQGVALGAVSLLLFARAVEILGATRAATLSVLVPATGLTTAALVLGEPIGAQKALGALVAVSAMLVAVLFTGRRVEPTRS